MDRPALRRSILKLLEADPPQEEKLWAELQRLKLKEPGHGLYASLVYMLTHLQFSEARARRHWRRIGAHRDLLRMTLGRDVGLRVALLDYFVNVDKELKNPKVMEISLYEQTARSAITDGLTRLFNRTYLLQALRREIQRSRRHGLTVSLALLDIDDFKRVNDVRGHLEGDRVLVKTAALIQESLREIDTAARYGGEEFAVILPETGRDGAYVVADRIRARIEGHFGRRRASTRITISGGVATFPEDAAVAEELIRQADAGLYRAKAAGKNQIILPEGERRQYPRLAASHPGRLTARSIRPAQAVTRNVSEGGVLVHLHQPVPLGSPVGLVIRPKGRAPVGLRGEVVRVQPTGPEGDGFEVAIRFLADRAASLTIFRRLTAAS